MKRGPKTKNRDPWRTSPRSFPIDTRPEDLLWMLFDADSRFVMAHNDFTHGVVFEPTPGATTIQIVREYMQSFGWNGASLRTLMLATGRSRTGLKDALTQLVGDGELRVEEEVTKWGPKACRRKKWHPLTLDNRPMFTSLDEEPKFED